MAATDRPDLFGTLQQTAVGDPPGKDSWMGHRMVDPARGKACPAPPPDPKGEAHHACLFASPTIPPDMRTSSSLISPSNVHHQCNAFKSCTLFLRNHFIILSFITKQEQTRIRGNLWWRTKCYNFNTNAMFQSSYCYHSRMKIFKNKNN